jgi:hypothetical protein
LLRRHQDSDRSRGQALVEFSLVFPVFILLLFGLIDLGRLVYANNALAEAAREGARWGSVQARSGTALGDIESHTREQVAGVGPVTVTASCVKRAADGQPCGPLDMLEVRVEGSFGMLTPVIGQLMDVAGLNPFDIETTARVLVNN